MTEAKQEIKDFLEKLKYAWDSNIDTDQKVLRDAYSSDPAKKAERQQRIGAMWMAAGDDAAGLTCE